MTTLKAAWIEDGIVVDEAAHARHMRIAWEKAILATLADYQGEAWFISDAGQLP